MPTLFGCQSFENTQAFAFPVALTATFEELLKVCVRP